MKKIINFNVNEERMPFVESWAKKNNVQVDCYPDFLTMDNVHLVEGYDGLTLAEVGTFDVDLYPELEKRGIKQIAQRTAGYENFDLELATKHNLIISNVHSYSPESIAEFSVLMGLQLIRKTKNLEERVSERDFRWTPDIRGRVIKGKTVAIFGVGNIGLEVAKLYKAFGAHVIGYDPYPNKKGKEVLTYCGSVEEAATSADIISLHMPSFDSNYHLFNETLFKQMKNDAILINAGRGSLIDTKELVEALDNNEFENAALDVYEYEAPYIPGDHKENGIDDDLFNSVLNHPKITFYHHCAFYTDESVKNMTHYALDAALEVIMNGSTNYRVN